MTSRTQKFLQLYNFNLNRSYTIIFKPNCTNWGSVRKPPKPKRSTVLNTKNKFGVIKIASPQNLLRKSYFKQKIEEKGYFPTL
jgi:hypothetical protein